MDRHVEVTIRVFEHPKTMGGVISILQFNRDLKDGQIVDVTVYENLLKSVVAEHLGEMTVL